MTQQDFSSSRIASAYHKFGFVVGGTVTSMQGGLLRHGWRISVQPSSAGQRRKTLAQGKANGPVGRPVMCESQITHTKSDLSRYHIPVRNRKPANDYIHCQQMWL